MEAGAGTSREKMPISFALHQQLWSQPGSPPQKEALRQQRWSVIAHVLTCSSEMQSHAHVIVINASSKTMITMSHQITAPHAGKAPSTSGAGCKGCRFQGPGIPESG